MRIVLMGPPGVGKGTQAVRLARRLGLVHVATGDILRDAVRGGTALGDKVREFVEDGRLVPDDLMGALIGERLKNPDAADGFVLDGFPRTEEQVATLDRVLGFVGVRVDRIIVLRAPDAEIVRRLAGRRVCPNCKAVFHVDNKPPRTAGTCDDCGEVLMRRKDDAEEVVLGRLAVFARQTEPAIRIYRERGLVEDVDSVGEPGEVAERLWNALASERLG